MNAQQERHEMSRREITVLMKVVRPADCVDAAQRVARKNSWCYYSGGIKSAGAQIELNMFFLLRFALLIMWTVEREKTIVLGIRGLL